MGGGSWSTVSYSTSKAERTKSGVGDFHYSDVTRSKPSTSWTVNDRLNVLGKVRECRDSDEHPDAAPIAVLLDVTGSMASVPQQVIDKLPTLFGLLLRKGYVAHPQLLFGAIGDAYSDRVPLQIGQFESDNRGDEDLGAIFLEGNGGGQDMESYDLAMCYMARYTKLDRFEKRGQRGYLFIIGDERYYPSVSADQVRKWIDPTFGTNGESAPTTEQLLTELKQKFDVYFIMLSGTSHFGSSRIEEPWRKLLGQNLIILDDVNALCETIALTVGLGEQAIDLDAGLDDLREVGSSAATGVVGNALAHLNSGGVAAKASGVLTAPDNGTDDGIETL